MINFDEELQRLMAQSSLPPAPAAELDAAVGAVERLFAKIDRRQADLSLQVEELYELAQGADTRPLSQQLDERGKQAAAFTATIAGLCDLLDAFSVYAAQAGDASLLEQARLLHKHSEALLNRCGMARIAETGIPLDPALHAVEAAEPSRLPREYILRVLQPGFFVFGNVLRRARVVVSLGEGQA